MTFWRLSGANSGWECINCIFLFSVVLVLWHLGPHCPSQGEPVLRNGKELRSEGIFQMQKNQSKAHITATTTHPQPSSLLNSHVPN